MRTEPRHRASAAAVLLASAALAFACGHTSSSNAGGDDGGADATLSSSSSGGSGSGSGAGGGDGGQGDGAGGGSGGGPITCSKPATNYAMNGGSCGTYRWAVKTGADDYIKMVNLTPQVTTVPTLTKIATPAVFNCNRQQPELQIWELKDVTVKFEREESDSDYHIVATDPATGQTMVTEVPYPGCVGQNPEHCSLSSGTPWLCEITHARAAVDAKVPQGTTNMDLGDATIIGPALFDVYELQGTTHPTGMAPNGIEIHPILAICFGKGCNPLQGY